MKNNIGHMRCPVCGVQTWVRENKNGILYTYCHNNHHAKLSSEDSRAAMAAMNAGKSWNNGVVYLYPEKMFNYQDIQTERTENGTNGTNNTNGNGTNTTNAQVGRRVDSPDPTTTGGSASADGGDDAGDEWDGGCGIF